MWPGGSGGHPDAGLQRQADPAQPLHPLHLGVDDGSSQAVGRWDSEDRREKLRDIFDPDHCGQSRAGGPQIAPATEDPGSPSGNAPQRRGEGVASVIRLPI